MTDINHILEKPYVDKGSYTVPDGYFNTLHDRIMERVDNCPATNDTNSNIDTNSKVKQGKLRLFSIKPMFRYIAAACLVGAISIIGISLFYHQSEKQSLLVEQKDVSTDQYYNDCMEYAMVDNDDIYMYLAEQ